MLTIRPNLYMASYHCPEIKQEKFGKFYAAINPSHSKESGCNKIIVVKCINKPYCNKHVMQEVLIVDYCISQFCPGKNDMILSKAAFDMLVLPQTSGPTISIGWSPSLSKRLCPNR